MTKFKKGDKVRAIPEMVRRYPASMAGLRWVVRGIEGSLLKLLRIPIGTTRRPVSYESKWFRKID